MKKISKFLFVIGTIFALAGCNKQGSTYKKTTREKYEEAVIAAKVDELKNKYQLQYDTLSLKRTENYFYNSQNHFYSFEENATYKTPSWVSLDTGIINLSILDAVLKLDAYNVLTYIDGLKQENVSVKYFSGTTFRIELDYTNSNLLTETYEWNGNGVITMYQKSENRIDDGYTKIYTYTLVYSWSRSPKE